MKLLFNSFLKMQTQHTTIVYYMNHNKHIVNSKDKHYTVLFICNLEIIVNYIIKLFILCKIILKSEKIVQKLSVLFVLNK